MEVSTIWFKLSNISPVKLKYVENVGMFWHILFIMGLQVSVYVYLSIYLSIFFFVCNCSHVQRLSQMGLGVVEMHIQVSEGLMKCFILRFKILTSIFLKENTESTGINWK